MMTFETILPMWQAVRERFTKSAEALTVEELSLTLGDVSIGQLLYHTAEVEYIFAEWYFDKKAQNLVNPSLTDQEALIHFLNASNEFLVSAMKKLPEEEWHTVKETRMGKATPLEIVGRLLYHTGIHRGQISDIQKHGQ